MTMSRYQRRMELAKDGDERFFAWIDGQTQADVEARRDWCRRIEGEWVPLGSDEKHLRRQHLQDIRVVLNRRLLGRALRPARLEPVIASSALAARCVGDVFWDAFVGHFPSRARDWSRGFEWVDRAARKRRLRPGCLGEVEIDDIELALIRFANGELAMQDRGLDPGDGEPSRGSEFFLFPELAFFLIECDVRPELWRRLLRTLICGCWIFARRYQSEPMQEDCDPAFRRDPPLGPLSSKTIDGLRRAVRKWTLRECTDEFRLIATYCFSNRARRAPGVGVL
ncbi:MAG: hypothetical protein KDC38_01580 [Planctomycetes bacterium]|nr:hypothetical protein [Planctomycetota bacterium]